MITENLLLIGSCLLIFLQLTQTSLAYDMNSRDCSPSVCGIIRNIKSPFRLKNDPKQCGDPKYELACENNVTTLYLNSQKYQVKAIDYVKNTIRVADVTIKNDICSFPHYSAYGYNFSDGYPYSTNSPEFLTSVRENIAWPINFMTCQHSLKNSSFFTETTNCVKGDDFSNSSMGRYTYIKVGHMNASDVRYMCSVDLIMMTSWKFKNPKNVSLSEIHESLLYGFELSWFPFKCIQCKGGWECTDIEEQLKCRESFHIRFHLMWADILIFLLIVVVLLGVASLGATIIIGFTYVWLLFINSNSEWFFYSVKGTVLNFLLIAGVSFVARFIIALPCLLGLFIYKFRRRHLSMYDTIENFLQSDNKLMPIRYSYSDIKRMTRGFRDKLGQGGYGSVYKGKLRSGHYVAVKLLKDTKATGRDFMNEIATIGRIHHVNVVRLVGYCAERSKRALVYDFMPNGSLDKYILNRETLNSLNWERKFDIAVGVARGIEYLHRGCDIQILHFDIKPHNILLDDKFIPKVSDFGLAKICAAEKNTVTLTAARGTIGYVAPELINRGIGGVSYKADVYSFGMLLIEMVGLKRDLTGNNEDSSMYFPNWIYDCFDRGKDIEIETIDENNDGGDDDTRRKIVKKMTIVALWCIQMSPDDRPAMNKVLEMLEGEVEILRTPHRPSGSVPVALNEEQTWSTYSNDSVSLLRDDASPSIEITVQEL